MRKGVTFLIVLLCTVAAFAQSGTVTSGGYTNSSNGNFSYSIGQVFYTTNTEASGSASQGIQRAFDVISLNNRFPVESDMAMAVFPNPTSDQIIVSLTNIDKALFSFVLYDLQGKTLSSSLLQSTITPVAMQNLSKGVYILKIKQNNRECKTFKIIKN